MNWDVISGDSDATKLGGGDSDTDSNGNTFNFGDDLLFSGDTLRGDIETFNWNITAGDVFAIDAFAATEAESKDNEINFGNDHLANGSMIVGDVDDLNWTLTSGNASFISDTSVNVTGNTLTFGNDTLFNRGFSEDSTLVGDINTFDIILDNAKGGGIDEFSDNTIIFGEDKLYGGGGNDTLIGDVSSFNVIVNGSTTEINGATDLNGAGVTGVTISDNTINYASDTFVISLERDDDGVLDPFGNDVIADWNAGGIDDMLRVENVLDINGNGSVDIDDLVAMSRVLEDSGAGEDIIFEIYDDNIGADNSGADEATLLGTVQFTDVSFNDNNTEITDYANGQVMAPDPSVP